jgi:hypothetical protein
MGCDIHAYKEKFVGGKWVTADTWVAYNYGEDDKGTEVPYAARFTDRNYDLFGVLAKGVRREFDFSFAPRGLPLCTSPEVKAESDGWDADGHNHSYLYLHELRELRDWLNASKLPISGLMAAEQRERLQASIDSGAPDWNLLYPYCQGTTDRTYVQFALDVPASFMVGDGLDTIIAGFDGIEGENHRLVFWFDN